MNIVLRNVTMWIVVVVVIFMLTASPAKATAVVDTGAGYDYITSGNSLQAYQVSSFSSRPYDAWVAAEFTLDNESIITDVLGWITHDARPDYNLFRIKIYGDGGDTPNTTEYLSGDFSIDSALNTPAWNGLHGLNLTLSAGTYWVAFEVPTMITINGVEEANLSHARMSKWGVPNPLGNEAWYYKGNWLADSGDDLDFGVQLLSNLPQAADPDPVPEPSSMLLLAAGFVGVAGWRKLRSAA